MSRIAPILPCVAVLSALCLVGCGGGPEGTYNFDKAATKKANEADAAKLSGKEAEAAKLGLALVDALEGSLELKPGGALTQKTTLALSGRPATPKEATGTWKKADGGITLEIGKAEMKCTEGGKSLTCREANGWPGHGPSVLIWTKG